MIIIQNTEFRSQEEEDTEREKCRSQNENACM